MKYLTAVVTVTLSAVAFIFITTSPVKADHGTCVQNGTKHAYLCYYHEPGTGGGIYLTDVLYQNWYYWHPKTGDQVVQETYTKNSAPGFDTSSTRRVIAFSDGHEIADFVWLQHFPYNKRPPGDCSQPETGGNVQACTSNEQQSAMDFQHAIITDQIGHSY